MARPTEDPIKKLDQLDGLTRYASYIYRNFGKPLLRNKKFRDFFYNNIYNERYEGVLLKANMKVLPEEYFLAIFLTIVGMVGFIVLLSIFMLFISSQFFLYLYFGGVATVVATGMYLYNYPIAFSKKRGAEVDAAIPYLLPYMKILSTEVNLSKMLSIIDGFLIYKEIRTEFRKIKYYSSFLGYDIHTSIRRAMESCPSRQLSDIMNDLATISTSGGDIYKYLKRKVDVVEAETDNLEKKNIDTLLILSQVYVVLLLISPLFFTIMTSILSLISFGGGGSSSTTTITGLLFALPFVYSGFMMVVYYSKPLYARLQADDQND